MSRPVIQVCPLCASAEAEHVSAMPLGAGLWKYTCTNVGRHHAGIFEWESVGTQRVDAVRERGVCEELGVYDVLLTVLGQLGRFAEHGVVEYEFAKEAPEVYAELVRRYSHTELGTTSYTASALLGGALGRMWGRDDVAYRQVEATGRWSYNGRTSAWCLPADADTSVLSWIDFATDTGLDPEVWPLNDLLGEALPTERSDGNERRDEGAPS